MPATIAPRPGASLLQAGSKAVSSTSLTSPARTNSAAPIISSPRTTFQRRKSPLLTSSCPASTIVSSIPSVSHPDCQFQRAWCSCASAWTSSRTASGLSVHRTSRPTSALRRARRRRSARQRRGRPASQASDDIGPSTTSSCSRNPRRSHAGPPGHWRRNSRGHSASAGGIHNRVAREAAMSHSTRVQTKQTSRSGRRDSPAVRQTRTLSSPSSRRSGKRELRSTRKPGNNATSRLPSVTTTTRKARES